MDLTVLFIITTSEKSEKICMYYIASSPSPLKYNIVLKLATHFITA